MIDSADEGERMGECVVLCCGVMDVMFIFGLDMPNPGPILSDQCRIFANLFMLKALELLKNVKVGRIVSCPIQG